MPSLARKHSWGASVSSSFVLLLVLAACGRRDDDRPLSERVQNYCHDLQSELRSLTNEYKELAGLLAAHRLSPEQQARAERALLTFETNGGSRFVAGLDFNRRFYFCGSIRYIEPNRFDVILYEVAVLTQTFRQTTDRAVMAASLEQLMFLAKEIDAMAIKQ